MRRSIRFLTCGPCAVLLVAVAACTKAEAPPEAAEAETEEAPPCDAYAVEAKLDLFNGEDFEGWKLFIPDERVDPDTVWEVRDGVVHCKGRPMGYMRTTSKYSNYRLVVEWRWPGDGGNSGVLIHIQDKDEVWPKSIEAQLQARHAGDFWVIGGTSFKEHTNPVNRRVIKLHDSNEKPLGEWNRMAVECRDDNILVFVNGLLQNVATEATVCAGYIGLQSEGTPIEFRTIRVEPLD